MESVSQNRREKDTLFAITELAQERVLFCPKHSEHYYLNKRLCF